MYLTTLDNFIAYFDDLENICMYLKHKFRCMEPSNSFGKMYLGPVYLPFDIPG